MKCRCLLLSALSQTQFCLITADARSLLIHGGVATGHSRLFVRIQKSNNNEQLPVLPQRLVGDMIKNSSSTSSFVTASSQQQGNTASPSSSFSRTLQAFEADIRAAFTIPIPRPTSAPQPAGGVPLLTSPPTSLRPSYVKIARSEEANMPDGDVERACRNSASGTERKKRPFSFIVLAPKQWTRANWTTLAIALVAVALVIAIAVPAIVMSTKAHRQHVGGKGAVDVGDAVSATRHSSMSTSAVMTSSVQDSDRENGSGDEVRSASSSTTSSSSTSSSLEPTSASTTSLPESSSYSTHTTNGPTHAGPQFSDMPPSSLLMPAQVPTLSSSTSSIVSDAAVMLSAAGAIASASSSQAIVTISTTSSAPESWQSAMVLSLAHFVVGNQDSALQTGVSKETREEVSVSNGRGKESHCIDATAASQDDEERARCRRRGGAADGKGVRTVTGPSMKQNATATRVFANVTTLMTRFPRRAGWIAQDGGD